MAEKRDGNPADVDNKVEENQKSAPEEEKAESSNHDGESDEEGIEVKNICQFKKLSSQCSGSKEACEKRMLSPSPTADLTRRYPCKSTKVCHGDVATSDGKHSQKRGGDASSTHSKECSVFRKVLQEIGDEVASSSSSSSSSPSECSTNQFVPISEPPSRDVRKESDVLPRDCDIKNKTDMCALKSVKSEDCQSSLTCKTEVVHSLSSSAATDGSELSHSVPLHINELPTLLMSQILSYLTMNELLCTASLVCKTWYQVAREPGLWKRVVLDRPGLVDEDLWNVVCINPNLNQLHITDCRHLTGPGVAKALALCSALKELVIMR